MRNKKGFVMAYFGAEKLKPQKIKKMKPNINCKHCNDYGFCVLTGQVCVELEKVCDNAERIALPLINCKYYNDSFCDKNFYKPCIETLDRTCKFKIKKSKAEKLLVDAMYNIGEEVFWIKNIALNWQVKERAIIISITAHGVDIKLKNPILIGPQKIKVLNLSVPKYELSKTFKQKKEV